jgi:hypothetical protein
LKNFNNKYNHITFCQNIKKNIVIIAAGGGNDIFSSVVYAKCILSNYPKENIAIIGILGLTPFYGDKPTEPNIIIPNNNMKRYILCNPPKQI